MAGPLEMGTYYGPTLQVADIVTMVDADPSLNASQRTKIIDELLAIRGKSTWSVSIELRDGIWTERQTVDGASQIGSVGAYAFPDDRTVEITDALDGVSITRFELTIDGNSFTLRRPAPSVDAEEEFVLSLLFESGPFTLR